MRDYASVLPVLLDCDLSSNGWNGCLSPYPGISEQQFALQHLRKSFLKKFTNGNTKQADAKALELFLQNNSKCSGYTLDSTKLNEAETIALGEAKEFLYRFFTVNDSTGDFLLCNSSIAQNFGLGAGSNIGSYSADFLSKVGTSRMSATDHSLQILFKQAISSDLLWSDLESIRHEFKGWNIVPGSRISFAAKSSEISRTICTEPILNMLFQKGIGTTIEARLKQIVGIDLSSQPDKNRAMAKIGSQTGKFGTIDLSSASDSISLNLVRELLPRQVLNWLLKVRSERTTLPNGDVVKLDMLSTMGNGYTFPLQTVIFCSLVYGAYRVLSIDFERPYGRSLGNFAVYGDDIIVLDKAYNLVVRMLSICGFSVNIDKSFNIGDFRESCGHDYFRGRNVRGVYLQRLKTLQDRYSAINRLNYWGAENGICLPRTVSYLLKGTRFLPVPLDEADTAGLKVPSQALPRMSYDLDTRGVFYRKYVPRPEYIGLDVYSLHRKLRGWIDNPPAILFAALAGTLSSGGVVPRSNDQPSYRLATAYSSSWDYIPFRRRFCAAFGDRLRSVVVVNLSIY
jgi:hypothetical protein